MAWSFDPEPNELTRRVVEYSPATLFLFFLLVQQLPGAATFGLGTLATFVWIYSLGIELNALVSQEHRQDAVRFVRALTFMATWVLVLGFAMFLGWVANLAALVSGSELLQGSVEMARVVLFLLALPIILAFLAAYLRVLTFVSRAYFDAESPKPRPRQHVALFAVMGLFGKPLWLCYIHLRTQEFLAELGAAGAIVRR
ncbi:MAG: hypothetical protein AAGG50_06755 [Bacteroidota bacterium]